MGTDGVIVSDNNICIRNSYKLTKGGADSLLYKVAAEYPSCPVILGRGHGSLLREWAVHTLLYKLHLFRSHTKDVDLNYPQRWWESLAYDLAGAVSLIFLK